MVKLSITADLKDETNFAVKIIYHIWMDVFILINIIAGLYVVRFVLSYLGMGDEEFIIQLLTYAHSATLLVFLVFVAISIIAVVKKEFVSKLLKSNLGGDRDDGQRSN